MSSRPSSKKALKKYAGSRAADVKATQALMNKVSRAALQSYASSRVRDLVDDRPYPSLRQMVPRGFVGGRGDAKFFDLANAAYVINTTDSLTHLSPVAQGTTVNTREGKAFRCTSINVRGHIAVDTTTILTTYAVYLVWDYQPNKVIATIANIFDTVSSFSFPNRENNERFVIVKKWYGSLSGNSTTPATGGEVVPIDDYVRLPMDANVLYTTADTTGAIGNVIQGALYLVTLGNLAAGTNDANASLGFRLNFTEKMT